MLDTLAELRIKLREPLGVDSSEFGDDKCDELLNRAYWALLAVHPFREKEAWMNLEFHAGVRIYKAPTPFEALRSLFVLNSSGDKFQLKRQSDRSYELTHNANTTGMPEVYFRENLDIRVAPVPDVTYDAVMHYWTTLTDLIESDDVIRAPREWREIVILGATWRGWLDLGAYDKMQSVRIITNDLIRTASPVEGKEEKDSPEAGVEVLGRSFK